MTMRERSRETPVSRPSQVRRQKRVTPARASSAILVQTNGLSAHPSRRSSLDGTPMTPASQLFLGQHGDPAFDKVQHEALVGVQYSQSESSYGRLCWYEF